jgi:hypothetical protein
MAGVPPLPDGWVECDGQIINDPQSPLDGQAVPDLNGEARFLRGANVSGSFQEDAFELHAHGAGSYYAVTGGSHSHNLLTNTTHGTSGYDRIWSGGEDGGGMQTYSTSVHDGHTHGTSGQSASIGDTETRPTNMSVVWIMRIK